MASLEDVNMEGAPVNAPTGLPVWLGNNPVKRYHSDLFTRKGKNTFNLQPKLHRNRIYLHVEAMVESTRCYPCYHPERDFGCRCMCNLKLEDEDIERITEYLSRFAALKKNEQQGLVIQWIRYASALERQLKATGTHGHHLLYLLPGTDESICQHALQRLIGYSNTAWKTVKECAEKNQFPTHGNTGKEGNAPAHYKVILQQFFQSMSELAAPRATRMVRQFTGSGGSGPKKVQAGVELRDDDPDFIELPPSFSRSSLYQRFLYDQGWKPIYDAKHRLLRKEPVVGRQQLHPENQLPCEKTFSNYWKENYPKLVTQKPRADICGQCYTFANRFRYLHKKEENDIDSGGEEDDRDAAIHWVNNKRAKKGDERDRLIAEREKLVMDASKHVHAAQKQREFVNEKREEAFNDRDKPLSERCITLVADFAQNAYVPNMNSEQPGETYYMSPVNAYIFGVADVANKPTTLTAHTFIEGDGVKGGNTVASLLWKELDALGLIPARDPVSKKLLNKDHEAAKEINIVMDNCIGQNKNNMVIRLLYFMVQRKLCKVARAIFLVKGHTKNDCDRLFNLMKIDYRKQNIYTPGDLMTCIAMQPDVKPIAVDASDIVLWSELQDEHMPTLSIGVQANHIYSVDSARDVQKLYINEWNGEEDKVQSLVKVAFRDDNEWYLKDPQQAVPPGLQYIKWKEMNDKWRPLVPQDRWKEWKYFDEDIQPEKRKEVTEHQTAAKKQRKGRGRIKKTPDSIQESTGATALV